MSKLRDGRLRFAGIWAETDSGTPSMEGAGGHERRCRLVQGMHGRGREQTENIEGSGWPYMAKPRLTVDVAYGHPREWP